MSLTGLDLRVKVVHHSTWVHLRAVECHLPCEITQWYATWHRWKLPTL